ncbi:MAG: glycosyltransferase family 2 protein [bacterium]
MKLSVLMPVYNESATIREILRRVCAVEVGIEKEVIVVDDGSTDGTREVLSKEPEAKVVTHERNMGKGAAIRTGLRHATGDLIIVQDSDLEYDPEDYRLLLKPILNGEADVVYGSRFAGGERRMFFSQWLGNRVLTFTTNLLYHASISDMETCYKLFRREALEGIEIKSNRFDFEPEITAKILKRGFKMVEVPISYSGRRYGEGKKITWRDGLSALWTLVKYRFVD